jgi:hypothetical protein
MYLKNKSNKAKGMAMASARQKRGPEFNPQYGPQK